MSAILWAVPLKSFDRGKARLAGMMNAADRSRLTRMTAERVIGACRAAGGDVVVITADADVMEWAADIGVEPAPEPAGRGLDGAAEEAARIAGVRGLSYAIVHADLPLLDVEDLAAVTAAPRRAALAPSHDGGTSLLLAPEPIRFGYGPGSFRRHMAAAAHLDPAIVVRTGLAVDLDTPDDLVRAARLARGAWLRTFGS